LGLKKAYVQGVWPLDHRFILLIILIIKSTRCTNFSNLFLE